MKKVILAAVLGGLIYFAYTFIAWMVLPFHTMSMKSLPNGELIAETFVDMNMETGVYYYPGMEEGVAANKEEKQKQTAEMTERYKKGPIISMMLYIDHGMDPFMVRQFILSLLLNLFSAFVISLMLFMGVSGIPDYWRRVIFILLGGLFTALVFPMMELIWWGFPAGFSFAYLFDAVVGWGLAGLVIARLVRPE